MRRATPKLSKPVEVFSGIMPPGRKLYTRDLFLRRLIFSDAQKLFDLLSENRDYFSRTMYRLPEDITINTIRTHIREEHTLARNGDALNLGIFHQDSGRLTGRITMSSVQYGIQHSAVFSYWIAESMCRKGFMTQALATLISFAFEELCLHRVWAEIRVDNLASQGLMSKLGFRHEGTIKENLFLYEMWQDTHQFSLLESEYDKFADEWIENGWLGC